MQQTNTYKLNLVETTDNFSPSPLNENMEKLEEALEVYKSALSDQVKFNVGVYTGTGTLGTAGKTVIKFPFEPKFVLVWGSSPYIGLFARDGVCRIIYGNSASQPSVTWGTKSLSLWTAVNDAAYQLNSEGCTYNWLAVG